MTTPKQTSQTQQAFEFYFQALNQNYPAKHLFRKEPCGRYTFTATTTAWHAFEFSREQALQDVINGLVKQKSWVHGFAQAFVEDAAQIGAAK